jgi:hypothetical protein
MHDDIATLAQGKGVKWRDMTAEERDAKRRADAARRARAYRARRWRAQQDAPEIVPPTAPRIREGFLVTSIILDKIKYLTGQRYRRFARVAGDVDRDEVLSRVVLKVSAGFAEGPWLLEELVQAAEWIAVQPGIPQVEQSASDAPHLARTVLAYATTTVSNTVTDAFRERADDPVSLERLESVATTSNNAVEDMVYRGVARIAMTGSRMSAPGGFDRAFFRVVVDAAVTASGGDDVAEILLDDDNILSNGEPKWGRIADRLIAALAGPSVPPLVPEDRKVAFAKLLVRAAFDFLPRAVIVAAAEAGAERAEWWRRETEQVSSSRATGPRSIRAPMAPDAWLKELDVITRDPAQMAQVITYTAALASDPNA